MSSRRNFWCTKFSMTPAGNFWVTLGRSCATGHFRCWHFFSAWRPRGARARDFVIFRKFSPACWRARGARARVYLYYYSFSISIRIIQVQLISCCDTLCKFTPAVDGGSSVYCMGQAIPIMPKFGQHPPFFSKMRTFFKIRPPWYYPELNSG
jgi:hypothetical protein